MYSFWAWYSFSMSFCSVPPSRRRSVPADSAAATYMAKQHGGRRVDGHRRGDGTQVDAGEEVLDVGQGVDGHAAPAHLALGRGDRRSRGPSGWAGRRPPTGRRRRPGGGRGSGRWCPRPCRTRRTSASSTTSSGTSRRTGPGCTGNCPGQSPALGAGPRCRGRRLPGSVDRLERRRRHGLEVGVRGARPRVVSAACQRVEVPGASGLVPRAHRSQHREDCRRSAMRTLGERSRRRALRTAAPSSAEPPATIVMVREHGANPQAPDRNLAMELVRVTEAAAMAARRWMGRGDKEGADGAAVEAMRIVLPDRRHGRRGRDRRGREGPRADAVQRRAHRRRHAAASRHRRRPHRRDHPHRARPRRGPGRDRRVRAGHHVQPGPVRLHGEAGRGAQGGRGRRHPVAHRPRTSRRWPRPWASRCATSPWSSSTGPATASSSPRCAPAGPASSSSPTATWPAPSPRRGPTPASTCCIGIGGTPEGVIAAAALKCMGGEIQGRLWPRDDDERRPPSTPATTSTPCSPPTTWCEGDNCFFAATGITDGELLQGVRYDDFGATTQSLVMRSKSGTVRLVDARTRCTSCASTAPSSSADAQGYLRPDRPIGVQPADPSVQRVEHGVAAWGGRNRPSSTSQ